MQQSMQHSYNWCMHIFFNGNFCAQNHAQMKCFVSTYDR